MDGNKNSFQLKRSTKILLTSVVISVIALGMWLFLWLGGRIRGSLVKQARTALETISVQNTSSIDAHIKSIERSLRAMADEAERVEQTDPSQMLDALKTYSLNFKFYSMGVATPDGTCYTTRDEVIHLEEYEYFQKTLQGEPQLSVWNTSQDGKNTLVVYTEPVIIDGEVKLVLTATYRSADFIHQTDVPSFGGEGHTIIFEEGGKSIAYGDAAAMENDSEVCKMASFLSDKDHLMPKFTDKFDFFTFTYNGVDYLASYQKMKTGSWYLITYVPSACIYTGVENINRVIQHIICGLYVIIALIAGLFLAAYHRYQRKIKEVVFYDRITKHNNFQSYKMYYDSLKSKDMSDKYLVNFDIDKFKMINLIYGVKAGDDLLQKVFDIFKSTLPWDEIYRNHADIFVAIIEGSDHADIVRKIIKFLDVIHKEMDEDRIPEFRLSFGICPMGEFDNISMIYSNAVLAKTEIKDSITEKFKFYDDTLKVQVEYRNMELSFKEALKNNEFQVWYQPKYDIRTRKICGAEALVRWVKPDGSVISPGKFIPVFENTGQIIELDEAVLRTVCSDIRQARIEGNPITPVSVNLSRMHLTKKGVLEKIQEFTERYQIKGSELSFEITESVSVNDKRTMDTLINELHNMSFQVDMDDYGTGSSTLWSLSDTSFDTIKLDKSFIDEIGRDKMDIIIQSTISMANHLKMSIVAEGVETEEQVDFLLKHHCYTAQGFYFAKPMEKRAYLEHLESDRRTA